MATNPFLDVRAKAGDSERSLLWYQTQVKSLRNVTPNRLLTNTPDLTTNILPGFMYMFFYDAKHKETLPYWDMFPLVLPFRKIPDGFLGINLHYLPYGTRFKLLGALHTLASDDKMNENTRLRLNWDLLEGSTRFAPVKACVKHYLYAHVSSKFLHVKYPDWVTAAMLPIDRFVGANKSKVWKDSMEKF